MAAVDNKLGVNASLKLTNPGTGSSLPSSNVNLLALPDSSKTDGFKSPNILASTGDSPTLPTIPSGLLPIESYNGVNINKTGMTDAEVQNIKTYIDFMAKDEDGSKLLKKASETGPMTIVYDPSITIGANTSGKTINVGKATLDNAEKDDFHLIEGMMGFAHEFVHAATENDSPTQKGDSKNEECIASTLGTRIAGRFYGKPQSKADEQAVYDNWMKNQMGQDAYKDLDFDNNIVNDLKGLGINFDGLTIYTEAPFTNGIGKDPSKDPKPQG